MGILNWKGYESLIKLCYFELANLLLSAELQMSIFFKKE